MWWNRDLILSLLDPTSVFLPLSEDGFGGEGDTLWSRIMCTNMGQRSEGAGCEMCSEDLGLCEGLTAPVTPVWLMLSIQATGTC